ncbi:MAG: UDP-N-acetylmuramate dehydrogenase [Bacteroidales bacterium]|nr:UDP-N-acetylmuramate dehydrogenase [Bacteroidales bacterium]
MVFYTDYSLDQLNTFNIKAKAEIFIEISSISDLEGYIRRKKYFERPRFILGNGSNVLFTSNFDGVVLKNCLSGIEVLAENEDEISIKVASGENFDNFVQYCAKNRYCGIENLSGIPGTVGASAVQNIGAYGQEASQIIECVEYYNFETCQIENIKAQDCKFEYRSSIFKNELKDKAFIISVTYKLKRKFEACVSYGNLAELLKEYPILTPLIMRRTIIATRNEKIPDFKEFGNAGSFFKNPEITKTIADKLLTKEKDLKTFPIKNGNVKLSAGQLIDLCGFKGIKEGNVGIAENQALVIINLGNATGKEILTFSKKIAKSVKERFGVKLEPEVCII